jgi:class 3 adenylate cyclase
MEQKDYRLAAIMYTDIAGFSRMMEKDESGTLELLKLHNELLGSIVASHHGTIIKTIGDALLVDFKNTVEAMQSALEIQDKLYAHNKDRGDRLPLLVRIGLHLGDIYFFENDALGEGINIAARLQSLARPGCICFSQDVYNLVLNKIEFRADKLGKVSLKNITKEIHAYEITTPNVEYDADRDKPRPGYTPGSYLGEGESRVASTKGSASAAGPAWASGPTENPEVPREAKATAPAGEPRQPPLPEADRSYTAEASASLLTEIRSSILRDIKSEGRRMTVEEATERYGFYGVEAQEVIAAMLDQGLLVRARYAGIRVGKPATGWGFVVNNEDSAEGGTRKAATDIGKTIEAAVHGIVTEIERSVEDNRQRGGSSHLEARIGARMTDDIEARIGARMERARERMERRNERRAERHDPEGASRWEGDLDKDGSRKSALERPGGDFRAYADSLVRKARAARSGFIGTLVSWLGVNSFLWYLNLSNSPGFPWAAIVTAAWGIGVASSATAAWRSGVKAREIENLPELEPGQLELLKKLNRSKDSIVQHGATAVTVPTLLAIINFASGPGFLWFLIPSAAIVISFVSHLLAYSMTKPRLERELKKALGVTGGWRDIFTGHRAAKATANDLGPYVDLWREAERAKAAILLQTQGEGGEDLGPALTDYVSQVRLLAASANDIDLIVEAIPMTALQNDKAALVAKEKSAASQSMKSEYRKSIDEIEKQERSYEDLDNQREVLKLRLGSAVNQLKQMRIDTARIKAVGDTGAGEGGLGKLKARTEELAHYLEDLRKGYDESMRDPFAELEQAERRSAELEQAAREKAQLEGPGEKASG